MCARKRREARKGLWQRIEWDSAKLHRVAEHLTQRIVLALWSKPLKTPGALVAHIP